MSETQGIFVSHSHADNDWCRAFVSELRRQGADVWYDEHNLGYGVLGNEIERELRARPIFIVALSPDSISSQWVQRELEGALHLARGDKSRVFLPIVAHQCDIPLLLIGFKRISGPEDAGLSPEEAARRVTKTLGIDIQANTPTAALPQTISIQAPPLPPTAIPTSTNPTTSTGAPQSGTAASQQVQVSRHAITDVYYEEKRTFLVRYPIWLIISVLGSGLLACGVAGFFGYQDTAEPGITEALFRYPWPLFLWLCYLIFILEVSILRHPSLRRPLTAYLLLTAIAIALVGSADFGLLGFLRPLGGVLAAITTSRYTFSIINFGLVTAYWFARVRRWPLRFQLSTPTEVVSNDLTGGIVVAAILAGFFWSPFLHFVHLQLSTCLVSWPLGHCTSGENLLNPPTLTSIDLFLVAATLLLLVLILAIRAILGQLATVEGVLASNLDQHDDNLRGSPVRFFVATTVLNLRTAIWVLLFFAAFLSASQGALEVQQYLHLLSDGQTCTIPGYLSCGYVHHHLLVNGEPYLSLALGLLFISVAFIAVILSIATLIFRWRTASNSLRFLSRVGMIILVCIWLLSISLSGFNGILWLLNHDVRIPFPQPEPLTIISFISFLLYLIPICRRAL